MEQWSADSEPKHNGTLPLPGCFFGSHGLHAWERCAIDQDAFAPILSAADGHGHRCHQLAMYVVFESPLADAGRQPANYVREPEAMEFLGPVHGLG